MTPSQRVLAACAFQRPDRIPRYDDFWSVPPEWTARLGSPEEFTDVAIRVPLEGSFVTRRRLLKEEQGWRCWVDEWGRTLRGREDAYFYEVLEAPLADIRALDSLQFDSPDLEERYLLEQATMAETQAALAHERERFCVFGKTGGPYLRSSFVRGEAQFLMDIAGDPPLAQAIADKVWGSSFAGGGEGDRAMGVAGHGDLDFR